MPRAIEAAFVVGVHRLRGGASCLAAQQSVYVGGDGNDCAYGVGQLRAPCVGHPLRVVADLVDFVSEARHGVREARARAIAAGEAVAVEFDSTTATYRFADRAQDISDDISVELATVSGARVSIRFYPDGASSGGVIRLIGTGGERLIAVDPLTSRIDLTHD